MAHNSRIASRYARAIFETLKDLNGARTLGAELTRFAQTIDNNPELKRVLTSRLFSTDQRRAIIEDLIPKLKLSAGSSRVLVVVSEMKRLDELMAIAQRLHELCLEKENIISIEVEHAVPLTKDEQTKVEKKFQTLFGKKVEATYSVEPRLLGGLRVTALGKTYDGSIVGWLQRFEEQLVGGMV